MAIIDAINRELARPRKKLKLKKYPKPKIPKPPKGFKPLRDTPSEAEQHIEQRLIETRDALADLGGRVIVHRYKNGTVDGEIAFPAQRGVSEEDMYRTILGAFGQTPGHLNTRGYWLSLGQRYTIKEGDEVYRRNRGMNEIMTYYAALDRRGEDRRGIIASTFGAARDMMTPGARDKFKRKAAMIIVRLHWNPNRAKPER